MAMCDLASIQEVSTGRLGGLADTEHEYAAVAGVVFQNVACLLQQVRNVDRRQRVGAFDDDNVLRW